MLHPEGQAVVLQPLLADDGWPLDSLLYVPDGGIGETAIVHLHGKGSSFLGGPGRAVPPRMPHVSHLVLNMRFRDLAYTRAEVPSEDFTSGEVPVGGGFWESIADGHRDVAAAVAFLRDGGASRVVVAGHSSGGFYTADYGARDPDLAGRILISPLTGNRTALPVWFPNDQALEAALAQARAMVAKGRGRQLIPLDAWYYAISAQSFLERAAEPDGVWLDAMNRASSPALMVWGGAESRDDLWRDLFTAISADHKEQVVINGAEHHFIGYEDELAAAISGFVDRL